MVSFIASRAGEHVFNRKVTDTHGAASQSDSIGVPVLPTAGALPCLEQARPDDTRVQPRRVLRTYMLQFSDWGTNSMVLGNSGLAVLSSRPGVNLGVPVTATVLAAGMIAPAVNQPTAKPNQAAASDSYGGSGCAIGGTARSGLDLAPLALMCLLVRWLSPRSRRRRLRGGE